MSHPVCAARSEQYHVGSLLQVPGARSLRNGRAWQAGARGAMVRDVVRVRVRASNVRRDCERDKWGGVSV